MSDFIKLPPEARPNWMEDVDRLTAEVEQCRFWNESVRVCADHTDEIVGDGCAVCDMERLQAVVDAAREEAGKIGSDFAARMLDLLRALDGEP